jgi:hypothetical protein
MGGKPGTKELADYEAGLAATGKGSGQSLSLHQHGPGLLQGEDSLGNEDIKQSAGNAAAGETIGFSAVHGYPPALKEQGTVAVPFRASDSRVIEGDSSRLKRFGHFENWDRTLPSKSAATFAASNVSAPPLVTRSSLTTSALRRTSHIGAPSCVNTNNINSPRSVETAGLGHKEGTGFHSTSSWVSPKRDGCIG